MVSILSIALCALAAARSSAALPTRGVPEYGNSYNLQENSGDYKNQVPQKVYIDKNGFPIKRSIEFEGRSSQIIDSNDQAQCDCAKLGSLQDQNECTGNKRNFFVKMKSFDLSNNVDKSNSDLNNTLVTKSTESTGQTLNSTSTIPDSSGISVITVTYTPPSKTSETVTEKSTVNQIGFDNNELLSSIVNIILSASVNETSLGKSTTLLKTGSQSQSSTALETSTNLLASISASSSNLSTPASASPTNLSSNPLSISSADSVLSVLTLLNQDTGASSTSISTDSSKTLTSSTPNSELSDISSHHTTGSKSQGLSTSTFTISTTTSSTQKTTITSSNSQNSTNNIDFKAARQKVDMFQESMDILKKNLQVGGNIVIPRSQSIDNNGSGQNFIVHNFLKVKSAQLEINDSDSGMGAGGNNVQKNLQAPRKNSKNQIYLPSVSQNYIKPEPIGRTDNSGYYFDGYANKNLAGNNYYQNSNPNSNSNGYSNQYYNNGYQVPNYNYDNQNHNYNNGNINYGYGNQVPNYNNNNGNQYSPVNYPSQNNYNSYNNQHATSISFRTTIYQYKPQPFTVSSAANYHPAQPTNNYQCGFAQCSTTQKKTSTSNNETTPTSNGYQPITSYITTTTVTSSVKNYNSLVKTTTVFNTQTVVSVKTVTDLVTISLTPTLNSYANLSSVVTVVSTKTTVVTKSTEITKETSVTQTVTVTDKYSQSESSTSSNYVPTKQSGSSTNSKYSPVSTYSSISSSSKLSSSYSNKITPSSTTSNNSSASSTSASKPSTQASYQPSNTTVNPTNYGKIPLPLSKNPKTSGSAVGYDVDLNVTTKTVYVDITRTYAYSKFITQEIKLGANLGHEDFLMERKFESDGNAGAEQGSSDNCKKEIGGLQKCAGNRLRQGRIPAGSDTSSDTSATASPTVFGKEPEIMALESAIKDDVSVLTRSSNTGTSTSVAFFSTIELISVTLGNNSVITVTIGSTEKPTTATKSEQQSTPTLTLDSSRTFITSTITSTLQSQDSSSQRNASEILTSSTWSKSVPISTVTSTVSVIVPETTLEVAKSFVFIGMETSSASSAAALTTEIIESSKSSGSISGSGNTSTAAEATIADMSTNSPSLNNTSSTNSAPITSSTNSASITNLTNSILQKDSDADLGASQPETIIALSERPTITETQTSTVVVEIADGSGVEHSRSGIMEPVTGSENAGTLAESLTTITELPQTSAMPTLTETQTSTVVVEIPDDIDDDDDEASSSVRADTTVSSNSNSSASSSSAETSGESGEGVSSSLRASSASSSSGSGRSEQPRSIQTSSVSTPSRANSSSTLTSVSTSSGSKGSNDDNNDSDSDDSDDDWRSTATAPTSSSALSGTDSLKLQVASSSIKENSSAIDSSVISEFSSNLSKQ
ncbi:hypothetical protein AYI69_g5844 [Smittium culicis]|uniref:Uncharacterized protein n=1 Tax=Smittium culicis TaxID=133412 RepID=A0A1R1Y3N9_9FUNG|nr:hypothetical protein AYI69_g5844 [Smittium culicis]